VAEAAEHYLAFCADRDLVALGLELDGKHCRACARGAADAFAWLRHLVFVGLLTGYRTSGLDERGEEEFELLRVAA